MSLPPIPDWDALHPLVVHFPIALLLVAPIFIVLGLAARRNGPAFSVAALVLMVLGTAGAWVAVATGEASAELADRSPAINAAIEEHEELAETTRLAFTGLTAAFAALVIVPRLMNRQISRPAMAALHGGFLVLFLGGMVLLANTAHHGGLLVHQHGVHVLLPASEVPAPSTGGEFDLGL